MSSETNRWGNGHETLGHGEALRAARPPAGTAAAIVVYSFTAYLDPTVFLPMLSVFAFCQ